MNSFQENVKAKSAAQTRPGTAIGSTIRQSAWMRVAPSTMAHSSTYFRTVPKEVEECAMVDGATRIQALWRIVLPIAVPGLVCAALFAFTFSWNEFIYALTFTSSSDE